MNVFLFASCSCSVLKDKLLTDSMMVINGEFPPVCTEHSYSLGRSGNGTGNTDSLTGNGAASDGDSIPESPLSLHDGKQHNLGVIHKCRHSNLTPPPFRVKMAVLPTPYPLLFDILSECSRK